MTQVRTSNQAEAILLDVLRTHLDCQHIGVDDDFYAMGGDSLIALRVVADASARGIPIELSELLYYPTVRELIQARSDEPPTGHTHPGSAPFDLLDVFDRAVVPHGVRDAWPASALQVGLIYLCEKTKDPRLYHDLIGMDVTGPFDERLFRDVLADMCHRHPALCSSFDLGSFSQPTQLVWSTVTPHLAVDRLTGQDAAAAETAVRTWRAQQLSLPIDWSSPPLFRCHVGAVARSFRVTLAIHHAIVDGWSYARLIVDILTCYDARLRGREWTVAAPPAQGYRDFVALEQATLTDTAAEFWQTEANVEPLLFHRKRFAEAADPAESVEFTIEPLVFDRLRDASGRVGVPLKSLVLAVHAWALGRWAGRDRDVVTGVTTHGRPEIDGVDLLVGLFLNTVPMRFQALHGTWADLARSALAAERRALPYRRYPLARIEQRLGRPAFDVAFNFTNFHVYRELDGLRELRVDSWWSFDKTSFPMLVDFMVEARRFGTGVSIAFDPTMVTKKQAERFAGLYRSALRSAAEDPFAAPDAGDG